MFDEDGNLKGDASNDEDELIELFNPQKIEGSKANVNTNWRLTMLIKAHLKRLMKMKNMKRNLVPF